MRRLTIFVMILALATVSAGVMGARMHSRPAGVGAGPVPSLRGLSGPSFDKQYVRSMYQHFSDIIALTSQGVGQVRDKRLKDLSIKVQYEQTKKNEKLVAWASQLGIGRPTADLIMVQPTLDRLSAYHRRQYEIHYARDLVRMLQQSRAAGQMGMSRGNLPELRDQSKITADSALNEINALNSWLTKHGSTPVM